LSALRLALRAYREFYDQVWIMLLVTVVWWCLAVSVIFAPAATILLFRHADPRTGVVDDRPGFSESGRILLDQFRRGWLIALSLTVPIALTWFNLRFYGGEEGALGFLTPFWAVLLVFAVTAAFVILALAAATELTPVAALKTGTRITFVHLPAALTIVFVTLVVPVLAVISTQFILLPLLVAVPGVVATAFMRFALRVLKVSVPDPNAPTEERLRETRSH
jgi:uncharacterized membrane protein YesL